MSPQLFALWMVCVLLTSALRAIVVAMFLRVKSRSPRRQAFKLADALRMRRELAHLSQSEAAAFLHVSTRTYWNWENGNGKPWPRHHRRIDAWLKEIA